MIPKKMRAVIAPNPGGPEVLTLVERPTPTPGPGEILIKVAAAGVNRPDVLQRLGGYHPPPGASDVLGLEVAGEIVALGEGVAMHIVGDEVTALIPGGGYAEYAIAHESNALPIPLGMRKVEAAAIPETFFTVWTNVFDRGALKRGEWLLVHGGASGIGTTAIMLAKAFGAKVIATVGADDKAAACKKLGADVVVNYRTQDFVAATREATGDGANVILDMVGGDYVARNYAAAAMDARIVQIAFLRGPTAQVGSAAADDEAARPYRLDAEAALGGREGGDRRVVTRKSLAAAGSRALPADHRFDLSARRGRQGPCADGGLDAFRQDRADDLDGALPADDRI